MLFICWLWRGHGFWKPVARYHRLHVARLASMLARHGGHRLLCVHDAESDDLPDGVRGVYMPAPVRALPDYLPKLWAWSPAFHEMVGERFASIDLDVVITGDLGPLLTTGDRLRIWNHAQGELYNSSLFVLEPGAHHDVWMRMTTARMAAARARAGYWTGDQSWIAHVIGPGAATFGERDGVIQYRPKLHRAQMPAGMLAGFMCGPYEPFGEGRESEWVRLNYV